MAAFYASVGRPEDADATLQEALALKPPAPAVQIAWVSTLVGRGKTDEALAFARAIQAAQPKASLGFVLEGEVLAAAKQFGPAADVYGQALTRQPMGLVAVNRYQARQSAGGAEAAYAELKTWTDAHPTETLAQAALGDYLLGKNDYKGAIARYEQALHTESVSADMINNLAIAYQQVGDPRALQFAEDAYRADPRSGIISDTLGWILLASKKDLKTAVALLAQAVKQAPEQLEIRYHYAVALAEAGDTARARTEVAAALVGDKPFPASAAAKALRDRLQ